MFFNRTVVDEEYGGLAFEEEGERVCSLLKDPKRKTLVMGNHGIMVIGDTVADTFNRMYYFERAARNYILALQTGQTLRVLSEEVAERTAQQLDEDHGADVDLLRGIRAVLDRDEPDYVQ